MKVYVYKIQIMKNSRLATTAMTMSMTIIIQQKTKDSLVITQNNLRKRKLQDQIEIIN